VLTLRLCVLYGSQNRQRLLPYTALTEQYHITEVESIYSAVRTGSLHKTACFVFKGRKARYLERGLAHNWQVRVALQVLTGFHGADFATVNIKRIRHVPLSFNYCKFIWGISTLTNTRTSKHEMEHHDPLPDTSTPKRMCLSCLNSLTFFCNVITVRCAPKIFPWAGLWGVEGLSLRLYIIYVSF
jgi:hypothetical protein